MQDVNKRAEMIANTVFHFYPYNQIGFKPDAPHAEDCGGCLINAEVEKIIAELEQEKKKRKTLSLDHDRAFEKANVVVEEGSVADLVTMLVNDRNRLLHLLGEVENEVNIIANILRE